MERKYGFGFDIGIGSVGFAVISWTNRTDARIEYVGVRLFDSGELPLPTHGNYRKTQVRRGFRSSRRLTNRRHHRKERAKRFLERINLISYDAIKIWQEKNGNQNVIKTRLKGLTERLTPEELADCIIHFCNNRGYREFYGAEEDEEDKEGEKKVKEIKQALNNFEDAYKAGNYKSVADMILHDPLFKTNTAFPDYHNHANCERYILIKRDYLQQELRNILHYQQQFYPKQLTEKNISFLCDKIVFAQRDFEDGPGDKDDHTRKYMGFLDSIGQCMFYKTEKRAFRHTVIGDIYALINFLSQLRFVDTDTGEFMLYPEAADEIIKKALEGGGIVEKDINNIVKKYSLKMIKPKKLDDKVPDTVKTLKTLKRILESCGYSYTELIAEDQFDLENPSRLHKLCIALSENISPVRRKKALERLGWNKNLQDAMVRQKFGGTASVCERYMLEAIAAFRNGEIYGNFQARRFAEREDGTDSAAKKYKYLPSITKNIFSGGDEEIVKNAVVFRSINETRKIVNALVRKYSSPEYINIEVADDLGRSIKERNKIDKQNKNNRHDFENISKKLVELGLRKEGEVRPGDVLRYRLWKAQEGFDLYSGAKIPENDVLKDIYDIDHIVPFSLVLDDTIQNKALVNMGANRALKAQQVPLEYLKGEQRENFKKLVNEMLRKKLISTKKYEYLMLESLKGEKAQDTLAEWKSRNINDTRYITRYITNYLKNKLQFAGDRKKHVFAVKGAITSKMRKLWLNKSTWGNEEKNRENNLHHAADAIVIANLTPACIEIASDNIKLNRILKTNRGRENEEYSTYLTKAIKKMNRIYGFDEAYTEKLLRNRKRIPSFVQKLAAETDLRLSDPTAEGYENYDANIFSKQVHDFYQDDQAFADSLAMPLVSYKQNKKFQGELTDSKPVKKSDQKDTSIIKADSFGNESILSANKYYCLEIYKDAKEELHLRGIRYLDLKKHNKKLYLTCPNPEGYAKHVMYLFADEYIKIYKSNDTLKFSGYYKSVKAVNRKQLYFVHNNLEDRSIVSITKKDIIKKFNVDILGHIGGEVKYSEPFMFLPKAE